MFTENSITAPKFFPISYGQSSARATGVQWTNPLEDSSWDVQLSEQNHAARSFFHGSAWANVLIETYGYKPFYLVVRDSGVICSLLPFMEVKSLLTGGRGIGLPFTDNCEPLCGDDIGFKELFRNAVELGKLRGWDYMQFHGGQKFFGEIPASLSFYTHNLDLGANEDALFGRLKSSVRRAIRKAEKSGVRAEVSVDLESVKKFYYLHCKSRRKHGLPPQPFSFFKNIHKHILAKGLGAVILARWGNHPIAGSVFFHGDGPAIYKFGASEEAFQHLRGNNLVMWEAIRWLSRRGARKLDLGRTSVGNEGLRQFKLGWNATEKKLAYFRLALAKEKFVTAEDKTSGLHTHVFQLLPYFASRIIGNILYRHWA